jgi:signal transduction histidine kinase
LSIAARRDRPQAERLRAEDGIVWRNIDPRHAVARVRSALPHGQLLPEQAWNARHRGIVALLWTLVPPLVLFSLLSGAALGRSLSETLPIISLTVTASLRRLSRRARGAAAAVGLLTFSALLIHVWGGHLEAHFAFFVVVALLTLYQDWMLYVLAIVYVVIHHALLAQVDGQLVAQWGNLPPFAWALIHGGFITAASVASMVSWRANERLEAQLQRAQRLESVGQIAGGVAHDFNNLLAVIVNRVSLARDELPAGHTAEPDLRGIEDAAERGARLVRQLLLFSQSRVGDPELLDLNALVSGFDGLLETTAGRAIAVRYELDERPVPTCADLSSLEHVLINLVANARDAIELEGTIVVGTASMAVDQNEGHKRGVRAGNYVRLSVTDDGCGMDAETLARACDPFFTTKGPGGGSGLGLAMASGFAEQAGGCVAVRSRIGAGTTVEMYLPAAAAQARPLAIAA